MSSSGIGAAAWQPRGAISATGRAPPPHARSRPGRPAGRRARMRAFYLGLLGSLRARRDLLLVDLPGTGRSAALDCLALQRTVSHYVARAGRCAAQLGARRDFYDTHAAVDDVAAVLDALHVRRVD